RRGAAGAAAAPGRGARAGGGAVAGGTAWCSPPRRGRRGSRTTCGGSSTRGPRPGSARGRGSGGGEHGLVFTTTAGTACESHNLRRDVRRVTAAAGLGARWVPKELRTSFVSMMSCQGVPVEEIARRAGHASSRTTEVVYRREQRPVITTGAEIMDQIF